LPTIKHKRYLARSQIETETPGARVGKSGHLLMCGCELGSFGAPSIRGDCDVCC